MAPTRRNTIKPASLAGANAPHKNAPPGGRFEDWKNFAVPTVKNIGPYRFHFYSSDRDEPRHIHVERDLATAKFWLDPVRLERSGRFSRAELARLQKLVERHKLEFRKKWNDYFGTE